ncbi:unnamed protein product [Brassica oleracea var. botrytis]|uniref:Cytochrome P450 n=1 Tax=Brassica oleracea var. oleracea TaxID=109376 RepID=A0A0D3DVP7_BRAOL|nr:PREDICTED: cytochrome P450 705A20-like [Brassica oleracea var. oleracea]
MQELFIGAGDSPASTTQWAMAEIINNPNILRRLREEIDFVVGKKREFQQECTIGGFYVAKGTTLVFNSYAVMRDPDYWEDPHKFNPERFLASSGSWQEEERREQAMKLLPFGGGRIRCPGSNVAIIVGTAIGVMVQCFDWKIKRVYEVNMEETSGLQFFLALAHPLECIPLSRTLNPLPTNPQITDL